MKTPQNSRFELASLTAGTSSLLDARLASYYPEIRAIRSGIIPRPRMAILYPVYGCSFDCLGCEYKQDADAPHVFLDPARYRRLNEELREMGVEGIELCGGGEPTAHPQLVDCTVHGGGLGLRYGLLTNGAWLTDAFFDRALPFFAYIRVSLDAADEEMFGRVRPSPGVNHWGRVIANVSRLIEIRTRRGLAFDVSLKFLANRVNVGQLEAFVKLARDLGADSAQFKALRCDPAELSPRRAAEADGELSRLRRRYDPYPILGSMEKVIMERRCELTPLQVTIDARGEVFLCCYFRHRPVRHSIGNIFETPLGELWGGEAHRRAIAEVRPDECSVMDCRFVRYHDMVDCWFGERRNIFSFI